MDESMNFNEVLKRMNALCEWVKKEYIVFVDPIDNMKFVENGWRSYFDDGERKYLVLKEDELDELLVKVFYATIFKFGETVWDTSNIFQNLDGKMQDEFINVYNSASTGMKKFLLDSLDVDYFELYEYLKEGYSYETLAGDILECVLVSIELDGNNYIFIAFYKDAEFFKEGE